MTPCLAFGIGATYHFLAVKISNLLKSSSEWVRGGDGGNRIVISSRLRLARNLETHPFPGWAKRSERERIRELVQPEVKGLPQSGAGP